MLAKWIQERRDLALFLVRLAFGLIFLLFGGRHVTNLEGYTSTFTNAGIPAPQVLAPIVAYLEILGGAAAILGIFTRYAGGLLAIVMIVSSTTVKMPAAFSINPQTNTVRARDFLGLTNFWDIDLSLFTMGVVLLLMGPGRWALEYALFKREIT